MKQWGIFVLSCIIVLTFILNAIIPFYWMFITSLKSNKELFSIHLNPLWVTTPTLKHYKDLFTLTHFKYWFINSAEVGFAATIIAIILGSLAAYGISRIPSRIGVFSAQIMILTYLLPRTVFVIPLYNLLATLRILDTKFGLILAYLSFTLPFTTWLLIGFFQAIPKELDEAAMIDGCSRIGAMVRVILPLMRPGIVATGIYSFSTAWNEFMYPLALIQTQTKTTLTVGIAYLQQGDVFAWGQIMAAGTVTSVPIVFFYALIYSHVIRGLVAGGIKG
ncbi:MAG: carbohydrate ABC transporter permease [Candidatus Bathyarchaeia archaeon]